MKNASAEMKKKLSRMKVLSFDIGAFSGQIYQGDRLQVLVIDHQKVELVETSTIPSIDYPAFQVKYGNPVRIVRNQRGNTLIYSNFAVDLIGDQMTKFVYFSSDL